MSLWTSINMNIELPIRKTVDNLLDAKNVISEMTNLVVEANELFKSMASSYMFIVDKTTDINRLCKDHISEEHHIQLFSKEIRSRLEVFDSLDGLSIKVTNKNLASNALKFLELLRQLDNSTKYLEKHVCCILVHMISIIK